MHRLIPQFILDNYKTGTYHGNFQAVGMLVDVTGFSTMTDVLAKHGMHGSEILANGMRQVFDPMIQSVSAYGGFVIGFAGDAITAVFPVKVSEEQIFTSAVAAALGIQEHRTEHASFVTPYGDFQIAVKIGLGAGEVRWRIVNAADGRRAAYYFRGSGIGNAVRSLSLSQPGEIILCPNCHKALNESVHGETRGRHFWLQEFSGARPAPVETAFLQPDADILQIFCSAEVSSHELTGEFRPAVNLFISIPPAGDQEVNLEQFIQRVFALQERYGGLFSRVDIGDKGTNLLMFWGAPIARENDVERALSFLLDLRQETELPIQAGITYRLAYAGYMGGTLQEEYTCYGWGVNLSARLMVAAKPGETWADEEIARRAGRRFAFQHAGKQKFKGFSQEQNVYKLLERSEDNRSVFSGKFVGREAELETLRSFIAPIWSGGFAGLLTIFGEPGIGKSRLVHTFQSSNIFSEHESYWAVCQTDDIVRQSLNPFRYWLKHYFGLSETANDETKKLAFDHKLDELIASTSDPDLLPILNRTRPFLGALVDLYWPDSLYEKLDAQGRYDNTLIALSALLRAESLKQPLIILLEDTHLLDSDTRAFLPYLERILTAESSKTYPVALIATSRREGTAIQFENTPSAKIDLAELSKTNLVNLIETLLGGKAAPTLVQILEKRAEGNPFFAEQIIRYLQGEQKLEEGKKGWQMAGDQALDSLPTDISAILISRLDRLNREVRDTVQTAAVLGREFELRLLSKMLKDDESLTDKIHRAMEADILSTLTEIRYIFRHALLRDAAYNMQLQARRQELHRIAVEAFETLYQDQLSSYYSEIAYHAERAMLKDKARNFYKLAGEGARRAYQNNLAIESYTRALALSTKDNIQERFDLLLARAALYRIIGYNAGQEQDLATLEFLAEKQKNTRNLAIVILHQADFSFVKGEFQEAQSLAQRSIELAESVQAFDIAAYAYRTLPLALARQEQIKEAIRLAQFGLQLTQQVADRESEGQIYNQLGLITLEQKLGTDQAREYFEKCLLIAQETGNRRLEAQAFNNLGNVSGIIENDYSNARKYYERALEIVQEIGNRVGESHALGNLGWVTAMQGNFEQARGYQESSLTIAREIGNRYQEAYTLINLSAMLVTLENYAGALETAERAWTATQNIGDNSGNAWALMYIGHAHLGAGSYQEASTAYQKALEIRYALEQEALAMEPLAGLAQAELEKGDKTIALLHVNKILSHFEIGGNLEGTEEPLRVYLTAYQVLKANNDLRANQVLKDAYLLLQEQIAMLQDSESKKMYVQNVPWRRDIEKLWLQNES